MNGLLSAPRLAWLCLFVAFNVFAIVYVNNTYTFMGDVQGNALTDHSRVIPVGLLVVASYIGILGIMFPALELLFVKRRTDALGKAPIGIVLLLLQIGFIGYVLTTGLFVAGSTSRGGTIASSFWVFVSVDTLFVIYYGFYRDDRLFLPNLALSVISNLIRGWTGVFVVIAFMETARWMRSGKMTWKRVGLTAGLALILYPILMFVKWQVRLAPADVSLVDIALQASTQLTIGDYFSLIGESFIQMIGRWQIVSNVVFVDQSREFIAGIFDSGQALAMWHEGTYGIIWDRLFDVGEQPPNIGFLLAQAIDPSQLDVSWNANPGFISWPLLFPIQTPLFLAYLVLLLVVAFTIVRRLGGQIAAYDMLWFACLLYILPGWTAAYVVFLNSLVLFWLFHWVWGLLTSRAPNEAS